MNHLGPFSSILFCSCFAVYSGSILPLSRKHIMVSSVFQERWTSESSLCWHSRAPQFFRIFAFVFYLGVDFAVSDIQVFTPCLGPSTMTEWKLPISWLWWRKFVSFFGYMSLIFDQQIYTSTFYSYVSYSQGIIDLIDTYMYDTYACIFCTF